jgi:hypothetical protein
LLDLLRASETISGYTVRAWTGVATDEGVGLISMVEVMDGRGVPVCRFEEFLADSVRRADHVWPREQDDAVRALQERALERARSAVLGGTLQDAHGHRYDIAAGAGPHAGPT